MSVGYHAPQISIDAHEYSRVSDLCRELAVVCIHDAAKCLTFAEAYSSRLPFIADPSNRINHPHRHKHQRDEARRYYDQIRADIKWFKASDGYALWVCATALSDDEAEAVRDEYLRRAEPLAERYAEALCVWKRWRD